jgi:hypothetical protein
VIGVAAGAVVKVTVYSRPDWCGELSDVLDVRRLGPTRVAQVRSWFTGQVLGVPVNEHAIELLAPPVPAGEVRPRG